MLFAPIATNRQHTTHPTCTRGRRLSCNEPATGIVLAAHLPCPRKNQQTRQTDTSAFRLHANPHTGGNRTNTGNRRRQTKPSIPGIVQRVLSASIENPDTPHTSHPRNTVNISPVSQRGVLQGSFRGRSGVVEKPLKTEKNRGKFPLSKSNRKQNEIPFHSDNHPNVRDLGFTIMPEDHKTSMKRERLHGQHQACMESDRISHTKTNTATGLYCAVKFHIFASREAKSTFPAKEYCTGRQDSPCCKQK